jgi:hypothetical protein
MKAPDRTYDPIKFQRGTRGFAAFVTFIAGAVVLGASVFVVPTLGLDPIASRWAVILGTAAGIAHLVAVVGLIRGRRWAAETVAYLSAAGIAVAGVGLLFSAVGVPVFGAERGTSFGFFIWMIGTWLVATRFAMKPFTFVPHAHRMTAVSPAARPAATDDARPVTGLRKRRPIWAAPRNAAPQGPTLLHPLASLTA